MTIVTFIRERPPGNLAQYPQLPALPAADMEIAARVGSSLVSWLDMSSEYIATFGNSLALLDRWSGRRMQSLGSGLAQSNLGPSPALSFGGAGWLEWADDLHTFPLGGSPWSLLTSYQPDANLHVATTMLIGPVQNAGTTASDFSPYITMTGATANPRCARGDGALRLADPIGVKGLVTVQLWTWSPSRGLRLRRNGIEVAVAASDVNALTDGRFQLGRAGLSTLRFIGKVGRTQVFSADLSDPDMTQERMLVEERALSLVGL